MQKGFNKKGISPLIATVLLIALVAVLALLYFLFASGFLKGQLEKVQQCGAEEAISLSLSATLSCNDAGQAVLTVSNDGTENIDVWLPVFYSTAGGNALPPSISTVKPGQSLELPYNVPDCGSIDSAEVFAGIVKDGRAIVCEDAKIQVAKS